MTPDVAGRLWSEALTSWVTLDGHALRLYTADGALRLTEAQTERRLARSERARARAERQRAETERQRAETAEGEVARLRALLGERANG